MDTIGHPLRLCKSPLSVNQGPRAPPALPCWLGLRINSAARGESTWKKQKHSDADEYPTVEDLRVALENALEGRTREQQQRIMYYMTLKLGGLLEKDARRKRVRRNSKNEKGLKVFEGGRLKD